MDSRGDMRPASLTAGPRTRWRCLTGCVTCDRDGRWQVSGHEDPLVPVDCLALVGLIGGCTWFGRGASGPSQRYRTGAIDLDRG